MAPTVKEAIIERKKELCARRIMQKRAILLHFAHSILYDWDDAEDVVQTCALNALEHIDDFREDSGNIKWFYLIIRNAAISLRRRQNRMQQVVDSYSSLSQHYLGQYGGPDQSVPHAADLTQSNTLYALIHGELYSMKETQREAIVLRYFGGLTNGEVGKVLGISVRAVEDRLLLGKSQLKIGLERDGYCV